MSNYTTITVLGHQHVLCEASDRGRLGHPNANYMGTKMALCGVIEKGKTLEEWILRRDVISKKKRDY